MEPAEMGYDHDSSGRWCAAHHRYVDYDGTCYLNGADGRECVTGDDFDDAVWPDTTSRESEPTP